MKKAVKILLPFFGIIIIALITVLLYFFFLMRPMPEGPFSSRVAVLKEGYVNSFLYRTNQGYIAFDSGSTQEKISSSMDRLGINPNEVHSLFLTHSDSDHSGGYRAFPQAVIYLPQKEEAIVLGEEDRIIMGQKLSGIHPLTEESYQLFQSGEEFSIHGVTVQTVLTPGHTPGSTCYIVDETTAFVGDMAIIKKDGLVPMPGYINNNQEMATESLRRFIKRFDQLLYIFTAHDGVLILPEEETP